MAEYAFEDTDYWVYQEDVIRSQGFHVSNDYGGFIPCGIRRVDPSVDYSTFSKAEIAARFAIEKHNETETEGEKLVFISILKVNEQPTAGKLYYITMAAATETAMRDNGGSNYRYYEAKVWETINGRYRVQIFRHAPIVKGPNFKVTYM